LSSLGDHATSKTQDHAEFGPMMRSRASSDDDGPLFISPRSSLQRAERLLDLAAKTLLPQ
jgi:hypothetical protein